MYFIFIIIYVGPRFSFHYIWAALGACLGGFARIMERGIWSAVPEGIRFLFIGLVIVGLIFFLWIEIKIFSKMRVRPCGEAQYVIVPGACVRGTRVTRSLAYRLEKAAGYARKHPDCMLVVSGGQGPGEDITEAQAMSRYLQNLGISSSRILLEDQSVNTLENLRFSRNVILGCENKYGSEWKRTEAEIGVVVCSNNFHMYRAMALASAVGKWKVYGLAARTDPFMWLSFTVREGAALLKEMLLKHIL